ncbi:helix-turn-helix domain-containing protein [Nitrospiraceae bacterium AH_259_D15_M11_P09]|nr:helix-turn-helix domain-containing protein [Nitrospiraceae bacterium AH_259_D15_M11_P09]
MRSSPPPKQAGKATGPRRFNGQVLDVHEAAALLGASEKFVRARVARRLLPFRQSGPGSRILFLRDELLEFYRQVPGCTLTEAMRAQKD